MTPLLNTAGSRSTVCQRSALRISSRSVGVVCSRRDNLYCRLPQIREIWTQALFDSTGESFTDAIDPVSLSALGIDDQNAILNVTITGAEPWAQDLAFNDYW